MMMMIPFLSLYPDDNSIVVTILAGEWPRHNEIGGGGCHHHYSSVSSWIVLPPPWPNSHTLRHRGGLLCVHDVVVFCQDDCHPVLLDLVCFVVVVVVGGGIDIDSAIVVVVVVVVVVDVVVVAAAAAAVLPEQPEQ